MTELNEGQSPEAEEKEIDYRLTPEQHAQLLEICARTGKKYEDFLADDPKAYDLWRSMVINAEKYTEKKKRKDEYEAWEAVQPWKAESDARKADMEANRNEISAKFSAIFADLKEKEKACDGDPVALQKYTPGKLPEGFDLEAASAYLHEQGEKLLASATMFEFRRWDLLQHRGGGHLVTSEGMIPLPSFIGLKLIAGTTYSDSNDFTIYFNPDNGELYADDQVGQSIHVIHEPTKQLFCKISGHLVKLQLSAQKELASAIDAEIKKLDPDNKHPECHETLKVVLEVNSRYNGYERGQLQEPFHPGIKKVKLQYSPDGLKLASPVVIEDVTFYQLGRNASHDFMAGFKDGKFYKYSCGEYEPDLVRYVDPESGDFIDEHLYEEVPEIGSFDEHTAESLFGPKSSYWGHF